MKTLSASRKGQTFAVLVDDVDHDRLAGRRWSVNARGYVMTFVQGVGRQGRGVKGPGRYELLHRMLLGLVPGDGVVVDHLNGDKLDNRRENLLAATQAENVQNRQLAHGRSRFRGVGWDGERRKWIATCKLTHMKNSKFLGRFDTEEEAAAVAAAYRAEHMPHSPEARARRQVVERV